MDFDNLTGLRNLIDRKLLPPRMTILVEKLEEEIGHINDVPPKGALEVKHTLALVGGDQLIAALVAHMLEVVPDEEIQAELEPVSKLSPEEDLYQRWLAAAHQTDGIALLLDKANYVVFDTEDYGPQATRIAGEVMEHMARLGRYDVAVLPLDRQALWQQKLVDAGIDATLIEETDAGYAKIDLLEQRPTDETQPNVPETDQTQQPKPDALDHDGDGKKGGSKKGAESTAHKGAAKKKTRAKQPA